MKYSRNKKNEAVLVDIEEQLREFGLSEVARYKREFPREVDYNIAQYGNLLVYYTQVRDMYKECGYTEKGFLRFSNDVLWETYKRQVGYVVRELAKKGELCLL